MKVYVDKAREVVTRQECTKLKCDLCGSIAEYPQNEAWEWGGAGTARGNLEYHWSMDGEYTPYRHDLCFMCAQALGDAIINRQAALLELIGRESEEEE